MSKVEWGGVRVRLPPFPTSRLRVTIFSRRLLGLNSCYNYKFAEIVAIPHLYVKSSVQKLSFG